MNPRGGHPAAKGRSLLVLAAGLLTGLGVTVLGQACYPACENVQPIRLFGGQFDRTDAWGDVLPHGPGDTMTLLLDVRERFMIVEIDAGRGHIVEFWELSEPQGW